MKIYLGIKFYEDNSNKAMIEGLSSHLNKLGHEVICIARDLEKWGKKSYSSKELMLKTFEIINQSDIALIEFSEKGVGLGIEAGYAFSQKIPVYVIAKTGSQISNTMMGIAEKISFYQNFSDIEI